MEPFMNPMGFSTEVIYSFIIIICSLMIFFSTKEIYDLSSYKGLKYFRWAFLFFAFAYFFKSFIGFLLILSNAHLIFEIMPKSLGFITLLLFMYFGIMALFYLLYSIMWKKWPSKNIYLFHLIAMALSLLPIIFPNIFVFLAIGLFLLILSIIILILAYRNRGDKAKGKNLYFIYVLLFIFWILNIFSLLIPDFFETSQLVIYLASIGVFLAILYKVLRMVGSD